METSTIYIEKRSQPVPEVVADGLTFDRAYDLAKKITLAEGERSYIEDGEGTMWVIRDRILNHMHTPYAIPGR